MILSTITCPSLLGFFFVSLFCILEYPSGFLVCTVCWMMGIASRGGSSFSFEGYWISKSRLLVRLLNLPSGLAWLVCWKAYNFLTNLMHQPLFIIRILTSFYFSQIQIDWILVIGFQQGEINQNRHILLNVSQGDVIVECNWSTYFISL